MTYESMAEALKTLCVLEFLLRGYLLRWHGRLAFLPLGLDRTLPLPPDTQTSPLPAITNSYGHRFVVDGSRVIARGWFLTSYVVQIRVSVNPVSANPKGGYRDQAVAPPAARVQVRWIPFPLLLLGATGVGWFTAPTPPGLDPAYDELLCTMVFWAGITALALVTGFIGARNASRNAIAQLEKAWCPPVEQGQESAMTSTPPEMEG